MLILNRSIPEILQFWLRNFNIELQNAAFEQSCDYAAAISRVKFTVEIYECIV